MEGLPQRKANRLKQYDYSRPGFYFVTVCAKDMRCCFGEVIKGEMILNEWGKIAEKFWKEIPKYYKGISLDVFRVMPNHVHGIIVIGDVGADIIRPYKRPSISQMVGSFKRVSSKAIHITDNNFAWHKSFYDHVIRKEESLDKIREYIINNPLKWKLDKYHPKNTIIR
ncbi:MAG: transposase [Patescibacteria group bacterium]|nr:transposase [Patescibacteria group bacterium]